MKKIFLSLMLLVMATPVWAADNWRLAIMAPNSIAAGQAIFFDYEILNPLPTAVSVEYRAYLKCINLPVKMVQNQTATIGPSARFYGRYQEKAALPGITAQDCVATIELLKPAQVKASKDLVVQAAPAFKANLVSAGNTSCPANVSLFVKKSNCLSDKKTVYLLGSQVYLNAETSLSGASSAASITYPSGRVWQAALPVVLTMSELGTYEIKLSSQKSGYAAMDKTFYLSAISQKPRIQYLK